MPSVCTSLEETNRSILNEALYKIITDVVNQLGIPGDTIIAMKNGMEIAKTDNSKNVSIQSQDNLPTTTGQRRVVATITEDYDEDYVTSTIVSQADAAPIFRDPHVDVSVFPVYVMSDIQISFQITSPSKTELKRIRDNIRVRLSQGRNILHHESDYNIIIPKVVEDFIADVYDLKQRFFPQTLDEYFRSNATKTTHLMTDLSNPGNSRIAVRRSLGMITGTLDVSAIPEQIEEDSDTNTYKLTVPYKLKMELPRELCMKYPVIICNKIMPTKYLDFIEEDRVKTREEYSRNLSYHGTGDGSLSYFEAHRQMSYRIQEKLPLNLPFFDMFPERVGHRGYGIVTSFLTTVDETDKRTLMNLRETGPYEFDDDFIDFLLAGERDYVVNPYMSLFYFGLHQDGVHFDNNILTITPTLDVKSKVDLGLIKPTRITVSVCLDPTCLYDTVKPRMMENKDLFLFWLSEYIRGINNFKHELSALTIPDNSLYRFFLQFLHDAVLKEEHDFIRKFIDIFSLDNLMIERLSGIMYSNTPKLYKAVAKHSDLHRFRVDKNFQKNYMDADKYLMRTVMVSRVQARRKTELPET